MRRTAYEILDNIATVADWYPLFFWSCMLLLTVLLVLSVFGVKFLVEKFNKTPHKYSESTLDNKEEVLGEKTENQWLKNMPFFLGIIAMALFFYSLKDRKNQENFSSYRNLKENTYLSNTKYLFGIDVSHYQGKIHWDKVKTSKHPIEYVFMRAAMGTNGKDSRFEYNWREAKKQGFVRGAYHYYRPNENSEKQFANFAATVTLDKGDFPPILDIEEASKFGVKNLRKGLKKWLKLAETAYGCKPVIYTGRSYYHKYLKGHIKGYPLWIASYSGKHRLKNTPWDFHQFTVKTRVNGIRTPVDGNDFKNSKAQLLKMCIQ